MTNGQNLLKLNLAQIELNSTLGLSSRLSRNIFVLEDGVIPELVGPIRVLPRNIKAINIEKVGREYRKRSGEGLRLFGTTLTLPRR